MSSNIKPIIVVQGAQWGSEGKGMVAEALVHERRVDWAVRTGGTNAGHTIVFHDRRIKMQQLPVGWTRPECKLLLAAGAIIDPDVLSREVALVSDLTGQDVRRRLFIDNGASIHLPEHANRSTISGRHYRIGATGKGVSEAVVDKIRLRGVRSVLFKGARMPADFLGLREPNQFVDAATTLNEAYDAGQQILIEGIQGTLLDLNLGPWPYTTHRSTQPASWLADCGLSPGLDYEIVLVARTFPIRVAGNSGPMPGEISWVALAEEINARRREHSLAPLVRPDSLQGWEEALLRAWSRGAYPVPPGDPDRALTQHQWAEEERETYAQALSELNSDAWHHLDGGTQADLLNLFEFTTVTRKLRRVARLDVGLLRWAVQATRPAYLALTFLNYRFPELWGYVNQGDWSGEVRDYCMDIADRAGARVEYVSTGPSREHLQLLG